MKEKIAIVILNWNGKHFLEKFLPSVIQHSSGAKIIVADNASTDDSLIFIENNYPEIQCIAMTENRGFAGGYNEALQQIDSEFYLLLNSDIEVTENWLDPLIEVMKDPEVAGCQPKILAFDEKNRFEHAGASGGYLDANYFPFCRGRIVDQFEHDEGQYDNVTEIFWATGAALLIRADLYHQAGGLDESFFAHMEEIDLCWRIKKIGKKFLVCPSSKVYHVGGGTLPYQSPRKTFLNFRNSLFMIAKNHEGWLLPTVFWRMSLDGLAGVRFLFLGEFKQISAVLKAHLSFYGKLSTLLKQRKEIQKWSAGHLTNQTGLYSGNILWARYIKGVRKFSDLNQRLFK
ncbi:MAG: glycosyltransferase family 2 protein [Bacteroidota bacterium]